MKSMTAEQRNHMLLCDPVSRVIPKLAVPTIISMLITNIYNMADTFFVSQLGTSASGAVGVIFSAMAAFCLAKVRFPGAKAINAIIVVALLYQSNVIYIMQYMVMATMGMIDTYWALILPSVAAPMNLFLMRQSMTQVPDAMIEAAKVDGAGMFRICWQVVMPNQKPALMTVIIFSFQAAWNIQGGTLVFSESLKTLPTVVQQAASAGLARAGVAMAAAVFMLVPPIVIFMLAQRQVIETMAHSGIKD